MIGQVAVVPSTPLVLTGMPGEPQPTMQRLGLAAGRALAGTAEATLVVVIAGGPTLRVTASPGTDLAGYGLAFPVMARDAAPAAAVAVLTQVSGMQVLSDVVADLAVLGRLVPPGPAVLGLTVPELVGAGAASRIAEAIITLAEAQPLALVVAGDLGAGHGPKPPRPGAAAASTMFDEAVVAALDNGRGVDLLRLDPELGRQSASRAVGALRVLGAVLDRTPIATVVRATAAPLGVGYVVAQGG